ncbi:MULTISPECIES: hypothetical protein [Thalassobacillus]|uniref:hypothetical protein n=1 Tax=Thalassobacillus TaxID=331971 RepID=UPI000A1C8F47|nr:hypothetical protein [Thalassobacillus devorans]
MTNEYHDRENEVLVHQLIRYYLKNHLNDIKNNSRKNNSFLYLDGDIFQLILIYMLMQGHSSPFKTETKKDDLFQNETVSARLDQIITETKAAYEDIIKSLKE